MPSGACVIRYAGKRGVVWRIKYADAAGRQVKETLGREADGWNRQRAERELGKRLDLVERERWRKPDRLTFDIFAGRFLDEYLPGWNLKPSTSTLSSSTATSERRPPRGCRRRRSGTTWRCSA